MLGRFRRSPGSRAVVGEPREADAGIRPHVHPGAPAGVGHHIAHREVLADVRQRTTAGRSARSALGAVDRQVVRDTGTCRHRTKCRRRRSATFRCGRQPSRSDRSGRCIAPTNRQVSSGLYFISSRVVGSSMLIPWIRLSLAGPMRLMPLSDSPINVHQQRVKRLCVVGDRGARRAGGIRAPTECPGPPRVGVAESLQRPVVGPDGVAARVDRHQHLVEVGGGLRPALRPCRGSPHPTPRAPH